MPKVTLFPSGDVIEVDEKTPLLIALREQGVYIKSSCGGVASCSDCIIKIKSGEDNLSEPPFEEIQLLGNVFHITKERLSCQLTIRGDVTVDVSGHDKESDQNRLREKTGALHKKTKVRKKEEAEKIKKEREERKNEKRSEDKTWHRHWEKNSENKGHKRLDGGRRPKWFKTEDEE